MCAKVWGKLQGGFEVDVCQCIRVVVKCGALNRSRVHRLWAGLKVDVCSSSSSSSYCSSSSSGSSSSSSSSSSTTIWEVQPLTYIAPC